MMLLFVLLILHLCVALVVSTNTEATLLQQCGNTTTYCRDSACCNAQYLPTTFGCETAPSKASSNQHITTDAINTPVCCKPGPPLEPSPILPNYLVIGDSVSIGYTRIAAEIIADACQLQHGPYDVAGGGAADTAYGLACLDNFLVTQRQTHVPWDVILFNFGLHNLAHNTAEAKAAYRSELHEIMHKLKARMPWTKIIYATTTPFMKDAMSKNAIVEELNAIAIDVMHAYDDIDILDLHSVVTEHCGAFYRNCDWCDQQPCDYHYNPEGYSALATAASDAFLSILNASSTTATLM